MTRIAVLGAGLIGGVLARELASEGEFDVSGFDANPDALSRLAVQAPVAVQRADLTRPDAIAAAVADADGVVGALPGRPGAGHITVFSNRTPGPAGPYTKVYELAPPVGADGRYTKATDRAFGPDAPVWMYSADSLDAPFVSGAERLANGLTFITSGPDGRIFEVTSSGEIVWDYSSPYSGPSVTPGSPLSAIPFVLFKTVRIPADHPARAGRRLLPLDPQP